MLRVSPARAKGQRGHWPGSSLTYVEPCHLLLPVMGSGCSCGTGDVMGRGVHGQLRPTAPQPWIHSIGCVGRDWVLRVHLDLGTRWWLGTDGHGPFPPGADGGGGEEGVLSAAQPGSIGIGEDDSCLRLWPEGKNGREV